MNGALGTTEQLYLDFGVRDVMPLGPEAQESYLVQLVCGCFVVVRHGRVLWRSRGFTLVCDHAAAS